VGVSFNKARVSGFCLVAHKSISIRWRSLLTILEYPANPFAQQRCLNCLKVGRFERFGNRRWADRPLGGVSTSARGNKPPELSLDCSNNSLLCSANWHSSILAYHA